MGTPERIYHGSVRVLSLIFIGLGIAILVRTIVAGVGGVSLGVLIGIVFIAVGCARLYVASRMRR